MEQIKVGTKKIKVLKPYVDPEVTLIMACDDRGDIVGVITYRGDVYYIKRSVEEINDPDYFDSIEKLIDAYTERGYTFYANVNLA